MEIEKGQLGAVGTQSVEFSGGALVVKMDASYGPASMDLVIKVDGKMLLDSLVAKLPAGPVEDIAKALEGVILGVAKA